MDEKRTSQSIIKSIIDELHISVRAFALGMDESYNKIYEIYSGRTRVIVPSVAKAISDTYGVNMDYLRTGRGEMFATDAPSVVQTSDDITNSFLRVIAALTDENKRLKERIRELENGQKNG